MDDLLATAVLFSDVNSRSGQMWNNAKNTLSAIRQNDNGNTINSNDMCGFSSLLINTEAQSSIKISNLEKLMLESSAYNAEAICLATLLAVAVQLPRAFYVYMDVMPTVSNLWYILYIYIIYNICI